MLDITGYPTCIAIMDFGRWEFVLEFKCSKTELPKSNSESRFHLIVQDEMSPNLS